MFRVFILIVFLSGCSGLVPDIPLTRGKVVSPEYLAKYEGGGSLSTVWYLGSDNKYHYFVHLVKAKTKYRIKKESLNWGLDYPYRSKQSVRIENQLSQYVKSKTEQGN